MLPHVTTVDDPSTARCDVPVTGMTCASCAARLESGLSGLAGVHEVHVNFVTRRARVTYDPARTGPASFAAAAADLGYSVPTREASDPDADEQRELLPRLVRGGRPDHPGGRDLDGARSAVRGLGVGRVRARPRR